jgi:putative ABC transport system permease protein
MRSKRKRRAADLARGVGLLGPIVEDGMAQLRAQGREHILTGIGLVWGSAAVVLLLSVGAGFYSFLDLGFKKTGDRYTMVVGEYTSVETAGARPGRKITLTNEDLERLEASLASASLLAAELQDGSVTLRTDFRTRTGSVSAGTPDVQHIKVLKVTRGRFYDDEDVRLGRAVAVLGANLAEIYFGTEDPLGQTIQVEGRPFEVIGVLERKGDQLMSNNALHDDMIWVPLRAGQRALGVRNEIYWVLVNPRRLEDIPTLRAGIRAALGPHHHVSPNDDEAFRIQNVTEFTAPLQLITIALTALLGFIGTVTLAIAGVGVANLMIAIVNNRRIELAVRRVCGARRGDLTLQLLVETAVIVFCGGALGVVVAVVSAMGIGLLPLPEVIPTPKVSPSVVLTTFGFLAVTGFAAGLVPARIAAQADPAAALRVT